MDEQLDVVSMFSSKSSRERILRTRRTNSAADATSMGVITTSTSSSEDLGNDHEKLSPVRKFQSTLSSADNETVNDTPMDIEEVRQKLAELENLAAPTKEEIDELLAQYSTYSDGSYVSDSDDDNDSSDSLDSEPETVIMKVLIVGNARCGKTSTIRQFVSKDFSEEYTSTIGADFVEKIIEYDDQLTISLQLWDIAGQDRFAKLTRAYFRDAKGAVIVCDITRENTIDAVVNWKNEIDVCCKDLNNDENIPVVMIANKSDLLNDPMGALNLGVNMQKCVAKNNILEWFRASAKNGDCIAEAFQCLIDQMVQDYRSARKGETSTSLGAHGSDEKAQKREEDDDEYEQRRRAEIIRLSSFTAPAHSGNSDYFGCECN